jgi:predicted membrane channel-forming protein YqfA (hemolysin III family)
MSMRRWAVDVVTVFCVTLVASMVVSALWNLIAHRTTAIDWETSFRFAIVLAIIVPWIQSRSGRQT